ncbi:acetyl-CoA synthetase-like protein [Xylaria palmicola]|nr:acetyl-CoA synthetase-like protein [Xylaria palmicola]
MMGCPDLQLYQPRTTMTTRTRNRLNLKASILSEISVALGTPISLLDLKSSFISNGGDSLSSIQLQAALRRKGIQIPNASIFTATDIVQLLENCMSERFQVSRLISLPPFLDGTKRKHACTDTRPSKRLQVLGYGQIERDKALGHTHYPMTEMQFSLIHSTLAKSSLNFISYFETHHLGNIPALRKAWQKVIRSEPIFNMSFEMGKSGGYMWESSDAPFQWEEIVVHNRPTYVEELERPLPVGLAIGSSFKVVTLDHRDEGYESTIIWRVHHALIDGTSFVLIRSKVEDVLAGRMIRTGPLFDNFTSQLQLLQQGHESAVSFWARQVAEHPSPSVDLGLPSRENDQEGGEVTIESVYLQSNTARLEAYAPTIGVTIASLYYAAWGLVLSRYADSECVCFGAVLSCRTLPLDNLQNIVGPLINTLPLRITLNPQSTVADYTRQVFASLLELSSFQWSAPSAGFDRNFGSAISVCLDTLDPEDFVFKPLKQPYSKILSDIPLQIDVGNAGNARFSYDMNSFFGAHTKRLGAMFAAALELILEPDMPLSACLNSLIGKPQQAELAKLGNWSSESTSMRSEKEDLVMLFEAAAKANPSAIAVQNASCVLTYAEVDARSSVVARHLTKTVAPGDIVCVHADGTMNWIIAIYSVLKAGAIYCPLEKSLPMGVRDTNFTTTKAKVFLVGNATNKSSKPASCDSCISVEEVLQAESTDIDVKLPQAHPRSDAYICFTSGSTGKPKGVVCQHGGLVAFQKDFKTRLCARPGWKVAQIMSCGFDGSIHEIFSALSYGATLVLRNSLKPFEHLKECDAAILTPSLANALNVTDFPNLKAVYFVGEAVPQNVCDTWASQTQVFNMYGPTEATCGATIKELSPTKPVTLGIPNPSTRVYILDSRRRPLPWGVSGELYLAGVQVSAGYIGRPEETSLRFMPDSVNPQFEGEYMYRTGDRAYWNEDGELVFMGRRDRQIKLRGFRIDLDDLESRIVKADQRCLGSAVTLKEDCLVALVRPADVDLDALKRQMSHHIPPFSLPRHTMAVDTFPVTPIGKLDYKAIAAMFALGTLTGPPSINIEEIIIESIRELLNIAHTDSISMASSFADLGGNSIHALSLSHRLSRALDRRVPVGVILGSATIQDLLRVLEAWTDSDDDRAMHTLGDSSASPIEREWWDKYQGNKDTSSFNVTYACQLPSSVHSSVLADAWNAVLRRHRLLWCRFGYSDSRGLVRMYASEPPTASLVEAIELQRVIDTPFDLEKDDLIRVLISPTHMLVVISHIISDLTTLRTLLREVAMVYAGKQLAPVKKTYFETTWATPASPEQLCFWSKYLSGPSETRYSVGNGNTRRKTWSGSSFLLQVPSTLYHSMTSFASRSRVTLHQLALAAVALAMQHDSGTCDMIIGAPYLNRNSEEDLDVVGLFLEPLPIRIRYPLPSSPDDGKAKPCGDSAAVPDDALIRAVQRSSRDALSHAMPWDQLLRHLSVKAEFPNHPLFDVMVTFHELAYEIQFPIDGIEFIRTWGAGAKFKLMAEFTERSSGEADLRLEYSDECFTQAEVELLGRLILEALEGLVTHGDYQRIVQQLRSVNGVF